MMRRLLPLVAVMLTLAGCSRTVAGKAVPEMWTADRVAGLAITDGLSGLREDAPAPQAEVTGAGNGRIDRLAIAAVEDVQQFWLTEFRSLGRGEYRPVANLLSYDSAVGAGQACGAETRGLVNAFHCPSEDLVAWDRGALLPDLAERFGDMAVVTVMAHEIGHAVQSRLGVSGRTILLEQQADCYTGAYFRLVAAGESPRFTLSTGPGLNQVLTTMFFIRDSPGSAVDAPDAHGNAFDRVSAFQAGFGEGPVRCARMDESEVDRRVTQETADTATADEGQLRPSDPDARADLEATVRAVFGADQPSVATEPVCGDAPASFCPDPGVVALDLDALDRIAAPARDGGLGDFAAFAEVVSRFALARELRSGRPVEGLVAAQRAACLTGAWAAAIGPGDGQALGLSPGDLDEAVAEMLGRQSRIAADVTGAAVPSGFARVDAFRTGFNRGVEVCATLGG
ncbi:neutral zinc metallopeptidase [Actinoplanes sp. TRM 88003]|uniref:Neutral zinc metallopeptidase n=1 Tax=Paractinoplanes aksuensis TaxID=2939490 RepID=A0ABT1DXE7_9ACTN|nr:neutral zinc metallopeptidase [Actinoplanes aksuensis]MCO8275524.1 neutral zinc metallopeptidase [Actinoplanes aksuensis]